MEHMNQSRERSIGRGLRGAAMVKIQHAAEALTADNRTGRHSEVIGWIDDLVFQALMVSFRVVMREIFSDRVSQLCLIEKDHSVETLRFDTSHKPFDVRVEIGGSRGQEKGFATRDFERGPKRFGKFCVAVHQDVLFVLPRTVRRERDRHILLRRLRKISQSPTVRRHTSSCVRSVSSKPRQAKRCNRQTSRAAF